MQRRYHHSEKQRRNPSPSAARPLVSGMHMRWLLIAIAVSSQPNALVTDAFTLIATAPTVRIPRNAYFQCQTCSTASNPLGCTTTPEGEPATESQTIRVRAAVYQPPPPSKAKVTVAGGGEETSPDTNPIGILTEAADVLRMASNCGIDLVQFPEFFLNGGRPGSGSLPPLDRESSTLSVVGNLCADLGVACILGYAEQEHESEGSGTTTSDRVSLPCYYNSLALFHADGSRAGNYRCVTPSQKRDGEGTPGTGHPVIEAIPIDLRLPDRSGGAAPVREIKVGAMCGDDALVPELARHLTRSGAQLLAVSGSAREPGTRGEPIDDLVAERVLPTRSIENGLPVLFSNYCGSGDSEEEGEESPGAGGGSVVVSARGRDLVRAPAGVHGDMPFSDGYLLPCGGTGGGGAGGAALYAADVEVPERGSNRQRDSSIEGWDLLPRIEEGLLGSTAAAAGKPQNDDKPPITPAAKGFGREVIEMLEQQQGKKRKRRRQSKRK